MNYKERKFHKYSDDDIRAFLIGKKCPLNSFVGNKDAVDTLRAIAFQAWQNENHVPVSLDTGRSEKLNVALLGSPGLGKTTLARLFAETVLLPFVELAKVSTVQQIFDAIKDETEKHGVPLVGVDGNFIAPPCIVFGDEIHSQSSQSRKAPKGIMNDFLKATEPDDSKLVKQGEWVLDCTNICWVVATTEWYALPRPFRERFEKIELMPYTDEEATEIVVRRFPSIPRNVAGTAAFYGRNIPRVALTYAKTFNLERNYRNIGWEEAALAVADKKGIDEFGMDREGVKVLTALGKFKYTSTDKLAVYCEKNEIELVEMILPALMNPPNSEPFIRHTRRGWMLMPAGIEQLKLRDLPHNEEIAGITV